MSATPRALLILAAFCLTALASLSAHAQYNPSAGRSAAPQAAPVEVRYKDEAGVERTRTEVRQVQRDSYGNAASSHFDLAVDGAFEGQTVVVLQLYVDSSFTFEQPRAALKDKGFSVYRWTGNVPSVEDLRAALAKANQFWLISGDKQLLTPAHVKVIQDFFNAGHGVYIWGDNQPYYADANVLGAALMDSGMDGNLPGGQTVAFSPATGKPGLRKDHLVTTGLEHVFEGITIATIRPSQHLTPLIWGSAGNLVTVVYEHQGKRAILDGGFTRLYCNWDTAGTGRYVKNAAAWLANVERFGDQVTAKATPPAP